MASDLGPEPTARDTWSAIGFTALSVAAQCMAWYAFNEADGDWMKFIGGGGRSPAVPMWVIFGLWCFATLLGIVGVAAYVRLVTRYMKSPQKQEDPRESLQD